MVPLEHFTPWYACSDWSDCRPFRIPFRKSRWGFGFTATLTMKFVTSATIKEYPISGEPEIYPVVRLF